MDSNNKEGKLIIQFIYVSVKIIYIISDKMKIENEKQ